MLTEPRLAEWRVREATRPAIDAAFRPWQSSLTRRLADYPTAADRKAIEVAIAKVKD